MSNTTTNPTTTDIMQDEFAQMVLRIAADRGKAPPLRYDAQKFALMSDDLGTATLFLHNLYTMCQNSPSERGRLIDNVLRVLENPEFTTFPKEWSEAQRHLLVKLNARLDPLVQPHHEGAAAAAAPISVPTVVGTHLTVELVYDLPEAIVSLDRPPESWGISTEEALAVGWLNLRQRSKEKFARLGPRTYPSPWQDNYDAARLGLTDLVESLPIRGLPVAMVPTRDHLVVTGSEDQDGLLRMATFARDAFHRDHSVSGHAFIWDGNIWKPFLPASGHAAYPLLRSLSLDSISQSYRHQQEALSGAMARTLRGDARGPPVEGD